MEFALIGDLAGIAGDAIWLAEDGIRRIAVTGDATFMDGMRRSGE
jgi:hypothetical protein